jgi:hypothetical protein
MRYFSFPIAIFLMARPWHVKIASVPHCIPDNCSGQTGRLVLLVAGGNQPQLSHVR